MALSDYAIAAWDEKGKPCPGLFVNELGNSIEMYKTWLYVRSKDMYVKNHSSYDDNIIAQVNSGSLNLAGFEIQAERTEHGTFSYVSWYVKKGKNYKQMFSGGICAYAYINRTKIEVEKRGLKYDDNWFCVSSTENGKTIHFIENIKLKKRIAYWDESKQGKYNYSRDYRGISPAMVNEYVRWLNSIEAEWTIKGWRPYDQGDMYIARHLKCGLPKQNKKPILMRMIGKLKQPKQSKGKS